MVPFKISKWILENSWNAITCEISLQLKWSAQFILVTGTAVNQVPTFTITNKKLYVPVVTLSTKNNV